jgi:uncharacterized membrane protein
MLNEIIMRGGHQPIKPLEADPLVALGFHGRVAIHALPVLLFASGYTHFIQRLPDRQVRGMPRDAGVVQCGHAMWDIHSDASPQPKPPSHMCRFTVMPIVVHATFQRDENPGKLSRFREWNWWLQVSGLLMLPHCHITPEISV